MNASCYWLLRKDIPDLDYANALLYGTPATNIHKLQSAQNSLSRVVLPHHPGSASSRLTHLHWLPVRRRIQYKIALLTYNSLSTNQPTIPQKSSSHVPTFAMSPLSQSESSIYSPTKNSPHLSNHPQCITTSARLATAHTSDSTWLTTARMSNLFDRRAKCTNFKLVGARPPRGAEIEMPKASRGKGMERGCPPLQPTRGSGGAS